MKQDARRHRGLFVALTAFPIVTRRNNVTAVITTTPAAETFWPSLLYQGLYAGFFCPVPLLPIYQSHFFALYRQFY
jgi:hypothetical protein